MVLIKKMKKLLIVGIQLYIQECIGNVKTEEGHETNKNENQLLSFSTQILFELDNLKI
jgi:hypothetical protein